MVEDGQMEHKSWIRTSLGPLLGVATLVFCGWILYSTVDANWAQVRHALTPLVGAVSIAAIGLHAMANAVLAAQWGRMLNALGAHLPRHRVAWVWTRAQLTRFAIGSAGLVSRPVLAKRHGVPLAVGTSTTLLESVWLMAILGMGLPFAASQLNQLGPLVWVAGIGCVVVVIGLTLAPGTVLAPLRWLRPNLVTQGLQAHGLIITGGYLGQVALRALAFVAIGVAIDPMLIHQIPLLVGTFVTAYLVGWLFIFSPGGLGPREAVVGLMLANTGIAPGDVVALIALPRIVEVLGELAYVGLVPQPKTAADQRTGEGTSATPQPPHTGAPTGNHPPTHPDATADPQAADT